MPIKELNLENCENLEGEWVEWSVLESQVLPQGNTCDVPHMFLLYGSDDALLHFIHQVISSHFEA